VNAPEIFCRFDKFNFGVALDARQVASAHDAADHVPSIRIRNDHGLPDGQDARGAKDGSIIEDNDSPALFPNRLSLAARFTRQTSDADS
jgi:hypothetical protein